MNAVICDLSDLPADQCACRIHAPKVEPSTSTLTRAGSPFPARFPGQCPECEERIHGGDPIVRTIESGYVHEGCA